MMFTVLREEKGQVLQVPITFSSKDLSSVSDVDAESIALAFARNDQSAAVYTGPGAERRKLSRLRRFAAH